MSASTREAMAQDWLCDLREFGPEIVSLACGDWRRSQTRRPTIADMRALCLSEQQRRQDHDNNLKLAAPTRAAYGERNRRRGEELVREGRDICNRWAKQRGYADFSAAEADGKKYGDVIKSILGPKEMPRERHTANQYGAVATEWKPSPERLAADRAKLGIEEPA